jgi:hypothetical protein
LVGGSSPLSPTTHFLATGDFPSSGQVALPWPFAPGNEVGGVLVEVGSEFKEDFMSRPLTVGSKVMIPPVRWPDLVQ